MTPSISSQASALDTAAREIRSPSKARPSERGLLAERVEAAGRTLRAIERFAPELRDALPAAAIAELGLGR